MIDDIGDRPYGNLWDGDADSEAFRYLALVSSAFATHVHRYHDWIQGNPYTGKNATHQLELGEHLEFVGKAMQEQGRLRLATLKKFGAEIVRRLGAVEDGVLLDAQEITGEEGEFVGRVQMALDDLVRSGLVDVVRARPGRIGQNPPPRTVYFLTPKGRAVYMGTAVTAGAEGQPVTNGGGEGDAQSR